MLNVDKLVDNKWVQNLFVWGCFFVILTSLVTSDNSLVTSLYIMLLLIPVIYINNFLILPWFHKNRSFFFFLFVLNLCVFTIIPVLFLKNIIGKGFFKIFSNLFGAFLLAVTFGMAIKIARDSFQRRQQEKDAELKLLKAQLNPHFLFNTLNNLYGLSVLKSDKLPDLMLQLSDLLRYNLYETKDTFVFLEKEIDYLENYISLEKIRLEAKTEIDFKVSGNIIGIQIAPMLLIVFVENAFKHLGKEQNEKSSVDISIEVIDKKLKFICKNTYDSSKVKEENLEKGKSGIGLVNAKKRLALIYPEAHNLSIHKENGFFLVELTLDI